MGRAGRVGPPIEPGFIVALEAIESGHESGEAVAADLGIGGGQDATALDNLEAAGCLTCSLPVVYARTGLLAPGGI